MKLRYLNWGFAALITALLAGCGGDDHQDSAQLRAVHASPDAPKVDILVNNKKIADASYTQATGFQSVAPGNIKIDINVNGSQPVVTALTANVALERNKYYTVFAANNVATIKAIVAIDENNAPAAGNAKVRVVHAAPNAANVDVFVTAPAADLTSASVTPTLTFNFQGIIPANGVKALEIPGGDYRIRVTPAGSKATVVYDSGTINVAAGSDLVIAAIKENSDATAAPISLLLLPKTGASAVLQDVRAKVRVGHFSPNTPTVDVYLGAPGSALTPATEVVSNATFSVASGFLNVAPGSYRASVALDGTTTEVIGLSPSLIAGQDVSVFAIGLNGATGNQALRLNAYPDDLSAPAAGKAKLRVLHLSPDAPAVDVVALAAPGGAIASRLVTNLEFPNTSATYLELPPGTYTVAVVPTGLNTPVLPTTNGVQITLVAGDIKTAAAIGCLATSGSCAGGVAFSLKLLDDN